MLSVIVFVIPPTSLSLASILVSGTPKYGPALRADIDAFMEK